MTTKSVKRTTEKAISYFLFNRPLHGLHFFSLLIPAVNCWAVFKPTPLRGLRFREVLRSVRIGMLTPSMPMSVARIERTGPTSFGILLVVEHREPGRAALDELLGDQVGLAQPELRRAARGVVDLHDHHRVRRAPSPARAAPVSGHSPATVSPLAISLAVGRAVAVRVLGSWLQPDSASAAVRPRATGRADRRERRRTRANASTWGELRSHALSVAPRSGRPGRPAPARACRAQSLAPPSTYRVWPVMYDASSLHRNAAVAAMSSG